MDSWMAAFCAGSAGVCLGLTFINVKIFTEIVKDKLQDKRRDSSESSKP